MTSGHVRPEPWPPMWRVVERVVVGPSEDGAGTLLSSSSASAAVAAAATHLPPGPPHPHVHPQPPGAAGPPPGAGHPLHHHHQHHHHWPHQAAVSAYLPPPPPPHHLPPLPPPPPGPPSSSSSGIVAISSASTSSHQQHPQQHQHSYQHEQTSSGTDQNSQDSSPAPQHHHHHRSSLKRAMSDSDCDDVFSEESGKEPCNSPGGDSCQHTSRKRRRGMIEKKRRDRINASLGELRRLVPAAARDPHSGKLEKAEILQLTVEHLRTLKNKGVEGYDSSKLAMDYHAVGWGECTAEVGRYLMTMEGLAEQDPLRLRLLSHLQSFQRSPEQQQQQQQQQSQQPGQQQQQHHQASTAYGAELSQAATLVPASSQPHPLAPWPPAAQYSAQYPAQYGQQQHGKPYRPWGAELAY